MVLPPNFQIRGMHTIIRDATCNRNDFVFYSDRIIRLVVEHALGGARSIMLDTSSST